MEIILAGGSGFLGEALQARLRAEGHRVRILTRKAAPGAQDEVEWTPDGSAGRWATALDTADAVVNLAGASIADGRWTDERKQLLRSSRIQSTRSLVTAMRQAARPPAVFVSASAVGYYGERGDEVITESAAPGDDFLADLSVEWEQEAAAASGLCRVVLLRTGIVLHPSGGALGKMLLPFRLGIGGPIGSGQQMMPWIHRDDWTEMVLWLIEHDEASGAFNVTAPEPVTNAEFTKALGAALHRPAFVPVPAFAMKLGLGEQSVIILDGQRAVPAHAQTLGYNFKFSKLDAALQDLLT